jgi:hypothetical protein
VKHKEMIMDTVPEATATVNFNTTWTAAVERVSTIAQQKLPEDMHGRIQRATALVLTGGVMFEEDGTCQVRGRDGTWWTVNGHCGCEDATYSGTQYCKHRLARAMYLRAGDDLRTPAVPATLPGDEPQMGVDPRYIVTIQGRPFVKYAGLLELAQERGLMELTAQWTYNDAELSLAEAVATFRDGRHFHECGDATPGNVTAKVAPHFRRVALTRAKARVLRDALGVDLVAVEELSD